MCNYSVIIKASKHIYLAIGSSLLTILGDLATIPKISKGKPITCPTNFLQRIHMNIGYRDCLAFGKHRYVLNLFNRETCHK